MVAAKILKDRKFSQNFCGIFLLSDGQDSGAFEQTQEILERMGLGRAEKTSSCFSICSFGYGIDHDPKLMRDLAGIRDGSFYFINDVEQVKQSFLDAVGGLQSVIAANVEIIVNLKQHQLDQSKLKFSKTFGNQFSEKRDQTLKVNLAQLRSGCRRDFVFTVEIPEDRVPESFDFKLEGDMSCNALFLKKGSASSQLKKINDIKVACCSITENLPLIINPEVLEQLVRVEGAEAMERAIDLLESGNLEEGEGILNSVIEEIELRPDLGTQANETKKMILRGLQETRGTLKRNIIDKKDLGLIRENGAAHMDQNTSANNKVYSNGTIKKKLDILNKK